MPYSGYWNSHHHWCAITLTVSASAGQWSGWVAQMVRIVGTVMKTRMSAGIAVQATSRRMSEVTVDGSPGSPTRVENQKIPRNIVVSTISMMTKSIQLTKMYSEWIRCAKSEPLLSVSIG